MARQQMDALMRAPEWEDRRQFVDSKLKALESVVQHKRRLYSPLMAQFPDGLQSTDAMERPFDFTALERITSPVDMGDQVAPSSPPVPAPLPKTSVTDREELLRRRRLPPPSKDKQAQSDANRPAFQQDHDALSADLVALARNLKKNNLAFQGLLKKDSNVVKEAELLMDTNDSKFKKEHEDLKSFRRSSWSSTKRTILIIFLLLGIFVVMYLFIKITSK